MRCSATGRSECRTRDADARRAPRQNAPGRPATTAGVDDRPTPVRTPPADHATHTTWRRYTRWELTLAELGIITIVIVGELIVLVAANWLLTT